MDVEHTNGDPGWAWGPEVQRRHRRVEEIDAMLDRAGEGNSQPADAVEVGLGPSKIISEVAYVVYTTVQLSLYRSNPRIKQ